MSWTQVRPERPERVAQRILRSIEKERKKKLTEEKKKDKRIEQQRRRDLPRPPRLKQRQVGPAQPVDQDAIENDNVERAHYSDEIEIGMNDNADSDEPNSDGQFDEEQKYHNLVEPEIRQQIQTFNDNDDDDDDDDDDNGNEDQPPVIVGFRENEPQVLVPAHLLLARRSASNFSFFGENTKATSSSFSGIALQFRTWFYDMFAGTIGPMSYLIFNVPIFVAVLVLQWFTQKNASHASGNLVCSIFATIFALFAIEFPKTIATLCDKLGVVNSKIKNLEVKVACARCSKVYDYQKCITTDPEHRGRSISQVCRNSIFTDGPPCNLPLLEHTLDRSGEGVFHSSPKQRYVCPGT
jgi:hypothetical protein